MLAPHGAAFLSACQKRHLRQWPAAPEAASVGRGIVNRSGGEVEQRPRPAALPPAGSLSTTGHTQGGAGRLYDVVCALDL